MQISVCHHPSCRFFHRLLNNQRGWGNLNPAANLTNTVICVGINWLLHQLNATFFTSPFCWTAAGATPFFPPPPPLLLVHPCNIPGGKEWDGWVAGDLFDFEHGTMGIAMRWKGEVWEMRRGEKITTHQRWCTVCVLVFVYRSMLD